MENTPDSTLVTPSSNTNEVRLIDVPITDENIALNVIVSFLNVAQKRGTFSIAESHLSPNSSGTDFGCGMPTRFTCRGRSSKLISA